MKRLYVPLLSTEAGRCLTMANWKEAGVTTLSCNLTALLMKPGFEFLRQCPDLATYLGWQGDIILNARMPEADKDGRYTLRSEYDGSKYQFALDEIYALIAHLKPAMVMLPKELAKAPEGVSQVEPDEHYLLSDKPAGDACAGIVYTQQGIVDIRDDEQRLNFSVIDERCACPTCEQKLTRAYLHHLLAHTPLLCQRFLIQHNVFFVRTEISNPHLRQL